MSSSRLLFCIVECLPSASQTQFPVPFFGQAPAIARAQERGEFCLRSQARPLMDDPGFNPVAASPADPTGPETESVDPEEA